MIIMIIFKRLSLKALSTLQKLGGGGGYGNKNNYINVSLRLHKYTSIHFLSHFCFQCLLSL